MHWLDLFNVLSEPTIYSSGSNNEPRSHFFGKAVFFVVFITGIAWLVYELAQVEKPAFLIPSLIIGLIIGFLSMMLSYRFHLLEFRNIRDYITIFVPIITLTMAATQ